MQALTVLEFLIKRGSDQCVENAHNLKMRLEDLQVFEYTSPDGRDHGVNVRHRYMPTSASLTCHNAQLLVNAHTGLMSLSSAAMVEMSIVKQSPCTALKQLFKLHTLHEVLLKQARHWPSKTAQQLQNCWAGLHSVNGFLYHLEHSCRCPLEQPS